MSNISYNFSDAIKIVGDPESELNKKKEEFESKYLDFLKTYYVVGDKNFKKTFTYYEKKRYSDN